MLTQTEADALIAMKKTFMNPITITLPPGTDKSHVLVGEDPRERFLLDLWRGTFQISKLKYQTRARNVIALVRLDVDGAPHTNPDGTKLGGTHIHIYREGYEDKWAYPVEREHFGDVSNTQRIFEDFCKYCNIENPPPFQGGLL